MIEPFGEGMSHRDTPDVPDEESLYDSKGRVIDASYVDVAVEEALDHVRGPGRPSLSHTGESPLLRVRISRELDDAVQKAADGAGFSRSEWVRQVLDRAAHAG